MTTVSAKNVKSIKLAINTQIANYGAPNVIYSDQESKNKAKKI